MVAITGTVIAGTALVTQRGTVRTCERHAKVLAMVLAGRIGHPDDYYHAAMILQHGQSGDSCLVAYELARRATVAGHDGARWLTAAAMYRRLVHRGQPQKYGTQFRWEADRWVLAPFDPEITDDDRAEWNVPPITESQRRAASLPPPPATSSN